MASQDQAYGIGALGSFLKAFAEAKKEKRSSERQQKQFEQTLAQKALELEGQKKEKGFQAWQDAVKYADDINKGAQKELIKDALGNTIGIKEPRYTAEEAKAKIAEYNQGIGAQYPGMFGTQPATTVQNIPNETPEQPPARTPQAFGPAPMSEYEKAMRIQAGQAPLSGGTTVAPLDGTFLPQPEKMGLTGAVPAQEHIKTRGGFYLPQSTVPATSTKPTGGNGGGSGVAGEKAMDEAFGKYYAAEITGGGAVGATNVSDLSKVAADLRSGKVPTGGAAGTYLPQPMQAKLAKTINKTRQDIQTVIFPTLKKLMGAQFTQEEGERVVNATYDSAQPPEVNADRAERLQNILMRQLELRKQAIKYWEQHGTLSGYKLPFNLEGTSADDIIGQLANTGSASNGETPAQRKARLLKEASEAR